MKKKLYIKLCMFYLCLLSTPKSYYDSHILSLLLRKVITFLILAPRMSCAFSWTLFKPSHMVWLLFFLVPWPSIMFVRFIPVAVLSGIPSLFTAVGMTLVKYFELSSWQSQSFPKAVTTCMAATTGVSPIGPFNAGVISISLTFLSAPLRFV